MASTGNMATAYCRNFTLVINCVTVSCVTDAI